MRKETYLLMSWKQNWGYRIGKVEYSQIVRRKLKALRRRLTDEFDSEVSGKALKQITDVARRLERFAEQGVSVVSLHAVWHFNNIAGVACILGCVTKRITK